MMMIAATARTAAIRATANSSRRTFVNWMTHYPDTIMEQKKLHQATARKVFTWQKLPSDQYVTGFGVFLLCFGLIDLVPGYYRLATGKGKIDD